ncbi:uncharacterized protein K460DRAFT_402312 [Cucurbitaria berberidis CBS 394.84]|uniref:Uncharacterized protein n=1 Tax=Cucurbitaria berberidis CBS 394.84 TaxID=1168544 RepID=A0A9P4GJV5_9PLEO|nr:uncharacterized protein K460DRAFT_402312 [Cucurbitaria berberidis CBS 394.84]KAF1846947.1 hypothetical protein K460DRAFT_402312 [Cucurbitaria berberidis CBS 394.84]
MSHKSKTSIGDADSRLRATAATFMPQNARVVFTNTFREDVISSHTSSENNQEHPHSSNENTLADTVSDDHNPLVIPPSEAHDGETKGQCALCATLGRSLGCCEQNPSSNCPHCMDISRVFAQENEKHKMEIDTLRQKVTQLEGETPEEKYERLCAEKNAKIEHLKEEVHKVKKEDEDLKSEMKEREKKLKKLEAELKKLLPAPAFTIKEAKKGKKK